MRNSVSTALLAALLLLPGCILAVSETDDEGGDRRLAKLEHRVAALEHQVQNCCGDCCAEEGHAATEKHPAPHEGAH